MKAEHFIYALFEGYGIKLIKSPGLNELLNGELIDYLCKLERDKEILWPNGVITVSRVHPAHDEHGRDGVWNHTIALRLMDFLAHVQPNKILSDMFIDGLEKPPKMLKPLKVEKT
jgi:hypothetical protein